MATYTNRNGTNRNDILEFTASGTYHANAGNDTINIKSGSIIVYTDSGNNILNVTGGSNHNIKVTTTDKASDGINGVENLTIKGANIVDAYLGSGKDIVVLSKTNGRKANGSLSQIHGGEWGDSFTVNAGAEKYQIYGDAGDDIFNIKGGDSLVFWGGAANDTFNVTGGTNIKLRGGDSADIYNVSVAKVDMQLGYGNDIVNVTAGDKQQIKANLGINEINLKAGSGHVIIADVDQAASRKNGYSEEQIKAGIGVGYGQDKLNISGTATNVTANLGDGRDVVNISSGKGHSIKTDGWCDTINISGPVSDSIFDAGAADDLINVTGGYNNTIKGGGGNDTYKLSLREGNTVIIDQSDAGIDDNDKLILGGNTKNEVVYLKAGNDLVIGQSSLNASVTIKNWKSHALDQIIFDDGTVNAAEINAKAINLAVTKAFINCKNGDNTIQYNVAKGITTLKFGGLVGNVIISGEQDNIAVDLTGYADRDVVVNAQGGYLYINYLDSETPEAAEIFFTNAQSITLKTQYGTEKFSLNRAYTEERTNYVVAGKLNNTLLGTGIGYLQDTHALKGNAAADSIIINQANIYGDSVQNIDLGSGNDTFIVKRLLAGQSYSLNGGNGNDTINFNGYAEADFVKNGNVYKLENGTSITLNGIEKVIFAEKIDTINNKINKSGAYALHDSIAKLILAGEGVNAELLINEEGYIPSGIVYGDAPIDISYFGNKDYLARGYSFVEQKGTYSQDSSCMAVLELVKAGDINKTISTFTFDGAKELQSAYGTLIKDTVVLPGQPESESLTSLSNTITKLEFTDASYKTTIFNCKQSDADLVWNSDYDTINLSNHTDKISLKGNMNTVYMGGNENHGHDTITVLGSDNLVTLAEHEFLKRDSDGKLIATGGTQTIDGQAYNLFYTSDTDASHVNISGGQFNEIIGVHAVDKIIIDWEKTKNVTLHAGNNCYGAEIIILNANVTDFKCVYAGGNKENIVLVDINGNYINLLGDFSQFNKSTTLRNTLSFKDNEGETYSIDLVTKTGLPYITDFAVVNNYDREVTLNGEKHVAFTRGGASNNSLVSVNNSATIINAESGLTIDMRTVTGGLQAYPYALLKAQFTDEGDLSLSFELDGKYDYKNSLTGKDEIDECSTVVLTGFAKNISTNNNYVKLRLAAGDYTFKVSDLRDAATLGYDCKTFILGNNPSSSSVNGAYIENNATDIKGYTILGTETINNPIVLNTKAGAGWGEKGNYVQSGAGNDIINVAYENANSNGSYNNYSLGSGDDKLTMTMGAYEDVSTKYNKVYAGAGNDTIVALGYYHIAYGEAGNDTITIGFGGNGFGGAGDDYVQGWKANYLVGGAGRDMIEVGTSDPYSPTVVIAGDVKQNEQTPGADTENDIIICRGGANVYSLGGKDILAVNNINLLSLENGVLTMKAKYNSAEVVNVIDWAKSGIDKITVFNQEFSPETNSETRCVTKTYSRKAIDDALVANKGSFSISSVAISSTEENYACYEAMVEYLRKTTGNID